MTRILLLPSDHGGGRGHVSRVVYLAERFRRQGFQPAIILEKKHYDSGVAEMYERFLLDTRPERLVKYQLRKPFKPGVHLKSRLRERPVYNAFNSLAYQVPRDGYWSERLVRYRLKKLGRIIRRFKPDVLVGDTHLLTRLLGAIHHLPVVQITRTQGFPPAPDFAWWGDDESAFIAPDGLGPFRKILDELQLEAGRVEDLLRGDRYLIPAAPRVEPVHKTENDVIYTGPFAHYDRGNQAIPFFDIPSDSPRIYVSIGGGAGRSGEKKFFEQLIDVFDKSDYRVLVSTGNRVKAKNYHKRSANMQFVNWIHGPSAIARSDALIFHGGYGTMMEALMLGKPALVLPSHSEQRANGERLNRLGVGQVLPIWQRMETLTLEWPYGTFTQGAGLGLHLDKKQIHDTLHDLIFGDRYTRLKELSADLLRRMEETNMEKLVAF
ncbi:MAG: hypothetical protein D6677_05155 [Calditrichaeota bacterium]|nr:MAG: hypothetical protein D6677_05155 [Calditrichota bacterium]